MHRRTWVLCCVGLLALSCKRTNPSYCDEATACEPGFVCAVAERECQPVSVPPDLRPPDDLSRPGDMQPGDDLLIPTGCQSDAECAGKDAARPACISGTCQPCTRNYQCVDSACDDDGRCHDKGKILTVDDTAGMCRMKNDPVGKPYCRIADALADSGLANKTKDLILLKPSSVGGYFVDGSFLSVTKTVRLVGVRRVRTDDPVIVREPIDILGNGLSVGIDDIQIAGVTASGDVPGIRCAKNGLPDLGVTIRWSKVTSVPTFGFTSDFCSPLRLISNSFTGNGAKTPGGGIKISNASDVTLYNNIIAANSQAGLILGFGSGASPKIAYNTITANTCAGKGCNLSCGTLSDVPIRYSIMAGAAANGIDGNCKPDNSVVPTGYTEGTNNLQGFMPAFVDPASGNFHLAASGNTTLRKNEPNPAVGYDIDGDPRPAGMVDIGADQLP